MLPPFIAALMLQNSLLARFQTFAGKDTNYFKRNFCLFQDGGDLSTSLLQVTVQMASDSECNTTYADYWEITDRFMCPGDPNGEKEHAG